MADEAGAGGGTDETLRDASVALCESVRSRQMEVVEMNDLLATLHRASNWNNTEALCARSESSDSSARFYSQEAERLDGLIVALTDLTNEEFYQGKFTALDKLDLAGRCAFLVRERLSRKL